MFSAEGEKVLFEKPVDPNSKNVEFWMGDVEDMMKRSIRQALLIAINNYKQSLRETWVISHPG